MCNVLIALPCRGLGIKINYRTANTAAMQTSVTHPTRESVTYPPGCSRDSRGLRIYCWHFLGFEACRENDFKHFNVRTVTKLTVLDAWRLMDT